MPRKANPTIGTVTCPHSGAVSAVRKDAGDRLYYVTPLGKCTLYTELGQEWILENAHIWTQGPPTGTPDWIARGRASPPQITPDPTPIVEPTVDQVPEPDLETREPDPDPDDDEPVTALGF